MNSPSRTPFPEGMEPLGQASCSHAQICDMLEELPMFHSLERVAVERLADYVQAFRARADITLFQEGGHNSFMCLLIDGQLDVLKEDEQGQQKRLATVRRGKAIGEMALIDQQAHSATVITAKESTLLLLSRDNLFRMSEKYPRLAFTVLMRISQTLSMRLRQTSGKLIDYL